jgi:hypothetical protein
MELTDELTLEVVSCSFSDAMPGLGHGHATWRILGPLALTREIVLGTIRLIEVSEKTFFLPELRSPESVGLFRLALETAEDARQMLLAAGEPPEIAAQVLPSTAMCDFLLTFSDEDLIRHLTHRDRHSEPLQVIDGGLEQTLEEYAPELYASMGPVFKATDGEEETKTPT